VAPCFSVGKEITQYKLRISYMWQALGTPSGEENYSYYGLVWTASEGRMSQEKE
jgi:hypothetical protein